MTGPTATDDDLVEIPVRPPREVDRYNPTTHFGQRLRERVPERHRGPVPSEIIETGRVTRRPWDAPDCLDAPGQPVAFTGRVDGDQYTVVVALRPDGFQRPDAPHDVITVWPGDAAEDPTEGQL
jgi:hypothetical protein